MNSSKYEYQVGLLGFGEAGQSIAKSLINKNKDSLIIGTTDTKNVYMANDGHANIHCSGLTFYNNNNKSYSLPNKDALNLRHKFY